MLPSVSYAPFEGTAHPDVDNIPTVERIRADMKKLSTMTRAIRLYSSTGGVELVPPIAAEFGLKVTVGAWIDKNADRNEREIAAAINLARRNSNVIGVVVGNETVYRGEQKVDDLIELIKQVKKSVNVPVTTGEIWNIWRDNPAARLLRRFHRRPRPALLGKLLRQAGGRSGGLPSTSCCATSSRASGS